MMSMAFADLVGATFWFADIMHSMCPWWMILNLYGYQAAQMWSCVIGILLPRILFLFPCSFLLNYFLNSHFSPKPNFYRCLFGA